MEIAGGVGTGDHGTVASNGRALAEKDAEPSQRLPPSGNSDDPVILAISERKTPPINISDSEQEDEPRSRQAPTAYLGTHFFGQPVHSVVPKISPGKTLGDAVIAQIFPDAQPHLCFAKIADVTKGRGVPRHVISGIAFDASGGWNGQFYENSTMPTTIQLANQLTLMQNNDKERRLLDWTAGIDFPKLHPLSAEYLNKISDAKAGMPNLSQWREIADEIQREVIREGLGQAVNGLTHWIRQGCLANPNVPRGGLWSALRMVDWTVRVSQLASPNLSAECPYILVPWLQSSLRAAVWILCSRFTVSIPVQHFSDKRSDKADLVKDLKEVWSLYSGL
ncbi:hypothetical protein BD410DRAFT_810812, partial [Rickenella mellea]